MCPCHLPGNSEPPYTATGTLHHVPVPLGGPWGFLAARARFLSQMWLNHSPSLLLLYYSCSVIGP